MTVISTSLDAFLRDLSLLSEQFDILAPSRKQGKLDYLWVSDPAEIEWTDELPYKSPKEAVFPRIEKLMTFTGDNVTETEIGKPMLLIGVKPCDLTALRVMDEVFTGTRGAFTDSFYQRRRQNIVLFGTPCDQLKPGCFCGERGVDRSSSPDCDAFLRRQGDKLVIEILRPLPDEILGSLSGIRTGLTDSSALSHSGDSYSSAHSEAASSNAALLTIEADESELFEAMPWDRYIEGCIGCGTCTYLCPTCHCFEFKDIEQNGEVSRYRCWDSCMYPKFTLHASGHNPRSSKRERFRQRVLHKYVYIPKNFHYTACTGCGRCVRACPGGVSIRKVVRDINDRLRSNADPKGGAV